MPIWLLITVDIAAIGFAAFKRPHDLWRFTLSLVVTFLFTILMGNTVDPKLLADRGHRCVFRSRRVLFTGCDSPA